MKILPYTPADQVDIAVDLGVILPPLPDILTVRELVAMETMPPALIIDGILHQGCKLILGGTSKSNKSWCLLDLALSVSSGQPWWGRSTAKTAVLYINFELQPWAIKERLNALAYNRPECRDFGDSFHVWNLRGFNADLTTLRPKLEEQLAKHRFGLIILDPAYKVLGNRDENANGDIASLMNELEALAQKTGAAIVIAHHFAKGDSTSKNAIDRMSGAGAWARDPDAILVLTPHEETDCFTTTGILRNLSPIPEFVLRWDYPLMKIDSSLNPDLLRTPQSKNKTMPDSDFVTNFIPSRPVSRSEIVKNCAEKNISTRTVDRYLQRLAEAGIIGSGNGNYWRKN